ncbi:SEL1 protein [Gigaspora margarita]|uniref:SEL1 protein n=1 Tax=Gigaspora margarita TaxID=4874 RepID=A0A8H4EPH5_GIGMA|nr:SEL1 protein [Gigaspora margarita]
MELAKGTPNDNDSRGDGYPKEIGVEKNDNKASVYYQESVETDYAHSTCRVGYCHKSGIGIEAEKNEACEWWMNHVKDGSSEGQFDPGRCCDRMYKSFEKACRKKRKKAREFLGENKGELNKVTRSKFIPPRAPKFDAAPGQAMKGSEKQDMKRRKAYSNVYIIRTRIRIGQPNRRKEKIGLGKLEIPRCMTMNLTKRIAPYLPK